MARQSVAQRISEWLDRTDIVICESCGRSQNISAVSRLCFDRAFEAFWDEAAVEFTQADLQSFFEEKLRCSGCRARHPSTTKKSEAEYLALCEARRLSIAHAEQKEHEEEAREKAAAQYKQECEEGKHGFWAADSHSSLLSSGQRSYDPESGNRDVHIVNRVDSVE
ncbi:hypothetical protein [Lysobacter sp. HA35]